MTDKHAVYASEVVSFGPSMALLGIDTNGAAPQRVYGFHVRGDIDGFDGETTQSFWLMATTDRSGDVEKSEFVMFADDVKKIEAVLGAIVSASVVPGYDRSLDGKFDGYANSAQIAFDRETSEECFHGLQCRVTATASGFSLRLLDNHRTVSSLFATMTPKAIEKTIGLVEKLRSWAEDHVQLIDDAQEPTSPTM